jgi:hypothetical protein
MRNDKSEKEEPKKHPLLYCFIAANMASDEMRHRYCATCQIEHCEAKRLIKGGY